MADSQTIDGKADQPESTESSTPDYSGRSIGDFQLLRRIGQGGMGQVYLARQTSLKRQVAIKILKPELAANTISLKRFQAEAEAVANITHANIVQVYAIGEADGLHYMALEYVDGRNLKDYLSKKGIPDLPLALFIMRQIAAALDRAGELGFVHRDIKPENILISRKGEVKITDFGLSRCFSNETSTVHLTQSGVTMGTPLYMAPEQVRGQPVDPRTDIYSFGVSCYHMLKGEPPFQGATPFDVALQHVQAEPPPLQEARPDLPLELCHIVHKMMAKRPEDRYQSAREILKDLTSLRDLIGAGKGASLSTSNIPISAASSSASSSPMLTMATGSSVAISHFPTDSVPIHTRRWGRLVWWAFVVLGTVGLAYGGAYYHRMKTPVVSTNTADLAEAALADVDPAPSALLERKLLERISARETRADVAVEDLQKLLQIYLKDRRFAEATKMFDKANLEKKKSLDGVTPGMDGKQRVNILSLMGRGVILAYQDQPEKSNEVFRQLLKEYGSNTFPKKKDTSPSKSVLDLFLASRSALEWRHLISEALERNAKNQNNKIPDDLIKLRIFSSRPVGKSG